ncbi:hypothetical protein [Pseudomonas fluorescens]|uniref:hypothetical protein n=1 Tax=Pseudomonas fluorescens TaxID=294 RepID=UPI0012405AE0|nr:hypothetical protein [Pseudomonas fluorescens]
MNEDQHRRRMVLWFGSFPVFAAFVFLILVLLLSDRTAPVIAQTPVGSDSIHQKDQSSKVMSQTSEPTYLHSKNRADHNEKICNAWLWRIGRGIQGIARREQKGCRDLC